MPPLFAREAVHAFLAREQKRPTHLDEKLTPATRS
jgi:hypothetical protein